MYVNNNNKKVFQINTLGWFIVHSYLWYNKAQALIRLLSVKDLDAMTIHIRIGRNWMNLHLLNGIYFMVPLDLRGLRHFDDIELTSHNSIWKE